MNTDQMKIFRVLLIGDQNVGKTSIIRHDGQGNLNHKPTMSMEFVFKQIEVQGLNIKLIIADTSGEEKFRSLTRQQYRNNYIIIVVYDVTKRDSFLHVQDWKKEIDNNGEEGVTIALVGNKIDKKDERQVSKEEGQQKANELDALFVETSVQNNINVQELLIKTIEKALLNPKVKNLARIVAPKRIQQEQPNQDSKGKCGCCRGGCC